jgi:3-hydroxyacyl-CoA dehydrogenase/enoyl-CoA hydratase/3-hydroxybutyryl-CoA epimerase
MNREGSQHIWRSAKIFNRIANLPMPTVAAINDCLGGGYELALACTYRVASTTFHQHRIAGTKIGRFGLGGPARVIGLTRAPDSPGRTTCRRAR